VSPKYNGHGRAEAGERDLHASTEARKRAWSRAKKTSAGDQLPGITGAAAGYYILAATGSLEAGAFFFPSNDETEE